jgi:hypothetical protein
VTRLGEFTIMSWLFTLGSFFKITEVAQILFSTGKVMHQYWHKMCWATLWAIFSQTHLATLISTWFDVTDFVCRSWAVQQQALNLGQGNPVQNITLKRITLNHRKQLKNDRWLHMYLRHLHLSFSETAYVGKATYPDPNNVNTFI